MSTIPCFKTNFALQLMVVWLLVLWLAMAVSPYDRYDWLLENLLVFFYAGLLLATYRRFPFSNTSYLLFTVFMSLHLVGAHYTYAETPVGFWIADALDLQRNHYDRIVHFSFGLLLAYPLREWLLRVTGVRRGWSGLLAVVLVLAFSAFYELLEAVVAMVVSPELGSAYLGTQGDEWDAQRDTGLAFAGSIFAMVWVAMKSVTTKEPLMEDQYDKD